MSIQPINETMDVIIPNVHIDINSLSFNDLIEQIELDNALYYFVREKRQISRERKQNKTIVHKLHRMMLVAIS